jgi:hypothetical protein
MCINYNEHENNMVAIPSPIATISGLSALLLAKPECAHETSERACLTKAKLRWSSSRLTAFDGNDGSALHAAASFLSHSH